MQEQNSVNLQEIIQQENDVEHLTRQVTELRDGISAYQPKTSYLPMSANSEELIKLSVENTKLKHRLNVLKAAIIQEHNSCANNNCMKSIVTILSDLFSQAIAAAFPELPDAPIVVTLAGKDPKFGDYQCNSAMAISKMFKQNGRNISPKDVANVISEKIVQNPLIEKLEVANAGYINIFISKQFALSTFDNFFEHGVKLPIGKIKTRVLVDFSSPNVAKEMHVGHLRSTIIGESISRLLEYLGYDVIRVNHIGDWGTQFGMLIAHLQNKFPNYLTESPPIGDLLTFYRESKVLFDENEKFKKKAYNCVVKLQSHDPDYLKAWNLICNVSRKEFQIIYDRLDITITERGESFYQSRMVDIVNELEDKNLLEDDDGRKIMWAEQNVGIPMTIVKSDGGFTYDTSDIAAIKYRLHEENADWLIYVTDAGQATHFDLLFKCARKVGILTSKHRVDHVGFGVVLGEDKKKLKTRSGETIRLCDLLDEGMKRSLDKLKEKDRHTVLTPDELKLAQEAVAYGCIKYADLSHNRNHEYIFSFDKMLEDKGNTAVYLLYAYTRIRSISRNANLTPEMIKDLAKKELVSLDAEEEWKLAKVLLRFPDVLLKITNDLCLHHLCEYMYAIATTFSEFYDNCYCIEKDSSGDIVKVNHGRILLAEITALIMDRCFYVLGIKPVCKM